MITEDFGQKIAIIAKEKFGSQKKMAEELGIVPSNVSEWVRGKTKPSLDVIATICQKAEISLDWLVLGKTFETDSLNLELFNEVVVYAIEFADEIDIPIDGNYLMACYDFINEEYNKNKEEPIKNIFNRLKPLIIKLRK
ncbi:Helix-turn-helix domain protein [Candidatus Hepatincolaceae symbiont of Richtersius coronifer]